MNIKGTVIKAAIYLVLAWAGWQLTDKGLSSASKEDMAMYEQLCKSHVKTVGLVEEKFEQTNIKVVKGSKGTDIYTFNYIYLVAGAQYTGHYTTNNMPVKWEVNVWYDPQHPEVHSDTEPCERLAWYKKRDYPRWWAWIGIPMLLIGGGSLYALFKSFLRSLFRSKSGTQSAGR